MPETSGAKGSEATAAKADGKRGIGSGPGIILVLAYGTLALAATEPGRYAVVDASLPPQDVHRAVVAALSPLLAAVR